MLREQSSGEFAPGNQKTGKADATIQISGTCPTVSVPACQGEQLVSIRTSFSDGAEPSVITGSGVFELVRDYLRLMLA